LGGWNRGLTKETDERVKNNALAISKAEKGRIISKAHREKIAQSLLGNIPWNKGLTKKQDARVAKYAVSLSEVKTGIKASKTTRRKMRTSQLLRYKSTSIWNKGKTKADDERIANSADKISKANKGRKLSKEMREHLSIARIEYIKNNPTMGYGHRGVYLSKKSNKHIRHESSHELNACKLFDKDANVLSFDRCKIFIPYRFNGFKKNYLPDFQVEHKTEGTRIIEIKPSRDVAIKLNQAKFKAAARFCLRNNMLFIVLTEKELQICLRSLD
jgi:hypothetical protein